MRQSLHVKLTTVLLGNMRVRGKLALSNKEEN